MDEGRNDLVGVELGVIRPELVDALPGCECDVQDTPASNVDLQVGDTAGNACAHPSDPSCGIDGGKCACALSNAQWFASRQQEPRGDPNDIWIVDEGVVQPSGPDGALTIKASVTDDCLLAPASTTASTNQACYFLDCDGDFGAVSCFDYTALGGDCGNASTNAAIEATSQDCMVRGTVPVRVHVEATGAFAREFCGHLEDGDSIDAVVVRRTGGVLSITGVNPAFTEVAVGAPCP